MLKEFAVKRVITVVALVLALAAGGVSMLAVQTQPAMACATPSC
jgi:hypothetical protein